MEEWKDSIVQLKNQMFREEREMNLDDVGGEGDESRCGSRGSWIQMMRGHGVW